MAPSMKRTMTIFAPVLEVASPASLKAAVVPWTVRLEAGYGKGFAQTGMLSATQKILHQRAVEDMRPLQISPQDCALEAQRFLEYLGPPAAPIFRYVQYKNIQQLATGYAQGNISVRTPIWRLAALAYWLKVNFPDKHTGGTG